MTFDLCSAYASNLPEAILDHPFGPIPDVYKVGGKMFGIFSDDEEPPRISLKCEPMLALELREQYPAVIPGYHLSKKHWNTVLLNGTVPDDELQQMIRDSYDIIVASLPKEERLRLQAF